MTKEAIREPIGSAWPRKISPGSQLKQGREMLNRARRYMVPAWVALKKKDISREEKFRLGYIWANGVREHIIAAEDPISSAKLAEGMYLTQSEVENRARTNMTRMVVRSGGTKDQGIDLAGRLISLTKRIQARRGVPEDSSIIGSTTDNKGPHREVIFESKAIA